MDEYIIDTNIIYYWSGLEIPGGYSLDKINHELENKKIIISELSLLELINHYEEPDKIIKIFSFIESKNISIHRIFTSLKPIIPPNYKVFFKDSSNFKNYRNYFINEKIKIESELLVFCIHSLISTFIMVQDKEDKLDEKKRSLFTMQCISMILGNREHIQSLTMESLTTFYETESLSDFKDSIESIILTYMHVVVINHTLSKHNKTLKDSHNLSDDDKEIYNDSFTENKFSKKIIKYLSDDINNVGILRTKYKLLLEESKKDYESEMLKPNNQLPTISLGVVRYFSELISKMLLDQRGSARRIEKNDIIDSQFLNYYPHYQILTFDKKFKNIIKEIDENYYNNIIDFQNNCAV